MRAFLYGSAALVFVTLCLVIFVLAVAVYALSGEIAQQRNEISVHKSEKNSLTVVLEAIQENCGKCNCAQHGPGKTGWVKPTGDSP